MIDSNRVVKTFYYSLSLSNYLTWLQSFNKSNDYITLQSKTWEKTVKEQYSAVPQPEWLSQTSLVK